MENGPFWNIFFKFWINIILKILNSNNITSRKSEEVYANFLARLAGLSFCFWALHTIGCLAKAASLNWNASLWQSLPLTSGCLCVAEMYPSYHQAPTLLCLRENNMHHGKFSTLPTNNYVYLIANLIAMSVCLSVCLFAPTDAIFFRPLIGPEIT